MELVLKDNGGMGTTTPRMKVVPNLSALSTPRRMVMTKELRCRDVGPDCDAVVTAENDDEVLAQVADHAQNVHGMTDEQLSDPAFVDHVRNQIHEQKTQG